jgi:tRNA dimethylallyltransferase
VTATPPAIAAIVGPTAAGKSALALALAGRLPLEIISADSRQVYRGMDIGTAKPSAGERAAVAHHLIDLVAPDEPFTVADWVAAARALLPQVAARERLPLIVGGTGLYLSALLDGFDFERQAWSPDLRARLDLELSSKGLPPLAERLRRLAPAVAAATDLRNPRRVLRALERAEAGDVEPPRATPYAGRALLIGLRLPREELRGRIERRARHMLSAGLLDETQRLLRAGYRTALPSMSGIGYAEAARYLAGEWNLEETVAAIVQRSVQLAKRQMTWFRRDPRISWLDAGDPELVERAAALLAEAGG